MVTVYWWEKQWQRDPESLLLQFLRFSELYELLSGLFSLLQYRYREQKIPRGREIELGQKLENRFRENRILEFQLLLEAQCYFNNGLQHMN